MLFWFLSFLLFKAEAWLFSFTLFMTQSGYLLSSGLMQVLLFFMQLHRGGANGSCPME